MNWFIQNSNTSLRFSLNVLKFFGFLMPYEPRNDMKIYFMAYRVCWFMILVGFINIAQVGEIIQSWGDIPRMTSASCLLFTNLAQGTKIISVVARRRKVQAIIDEAEEELIAEDRKEGVEIVKSSNRGTNAGFYGYSCLAAITVLGWACSAEKRQLPLRAWYPYDTSESPVYELTYANQISALILSAIVNVSLDTLVTSLIALCRCRLRLVKLSLRTLGDGITTNGKQLISIEEEMTVHSRFQICVHKHESALKAASQMQACFTEHILSQVTVSTVIICVTAYQLAMELSMKRWIRIISMVAYLFCMTLQLFLYCYEGNQLTEESSGIAGAAYECPWYACSARLRRALLVVMLRSRRVAKLTAGGFTTLSLASYMSIVKASYTFFTVLRQV